MPCMGKDARDAVARGGRSDERSDMVALAVTPEPELKELTPYDFIEEWSERIATATLPDAETLDEVARALHAVHEFLVEPVARRYKQVVADVQEGGVREIPLEERPIDYEMIGRLIAWTDDLRAECGYLLDELGDIALLAHEDLRTIAEGYIPDGILSQPEWKERERRFHGLDQLRW